MIEILLWQDIKNLGKRGEVVKVKDGYARNYLFPRKLASLPTPTNFKELAYEEKRLIRRQAQEKLAAQDLAKLIEKSSYILEVRANQQGVLFGSVTPQLIAETLTKEGVKDIKPEMIELEKPIKELGVYQVKIKLHPEIVAECRLWVVEASETVDNQSLDTQLETV